MNKKISFAEKKEIQMQMLREIDVYCRQHKIRYSLAYGTLLGAIRHKGFIPWDDDVDIMMPLPDMIRFKNGFNSANVEYHDVWNDKYYEHSFSRLAHRKSYSREGAFTSYGICIDLYVMIGVPENDTDYEAYFKLIEPVYNKTLFLLMWQRRFARRFSFIKRIPGFTATNRKLADIFLNKSIDYNRAKRFYNIAGHIIRRKKMTYDRDLFANLIDVEFQGEKFLATADYDYYMRLCYGDYMQLPPEDQRVLYHGGNFFWKEKQ